MSKIEKKRKKLQDRITELEEEMFINLKQKTSNTNEINLFEYQTKIATLKRTLQELK